MKIHVSQVSEDEGLRIHHRFPEGEPELKAQDCVTVGRPSLDAFATRSGDELRLEGSLSAKVEILCARCLAPITVPVDESFDLFYLPSTDPRFLNEERELAEEDLLVGVYRGDCIDLGEFLGEQIELALPMARLCSEDCRGLCVDCHANLNRQQCSCRSQQTEPRWAALQEWKSDGK
jgi:uncharacterized protein